DFLGYVFCPGAVTQNSRRGTKDVVQVRERLSFKPIGSRRHRRSRRGRLGRISRKPVLRAFEDFHTSLNATWGFVYSRVLSFFRELPQVLDNKTGTRCRPEAGSVSPGKKEFGIE